MNREIKFRGKTPDGKWITGSETFIRDGDGVWLSDGCDVVKVIEDTVGQFTGLCDANGREIYEGDVIKSKFNNIHHVIGYNDNRGAFTATMINKYMDNTDGLKTECNSEQRWITEWSKIIVGNIYDNLEILKGGEK